MLKSPLNKGNIRTGEITPFSNIILESNVTFKFNSHVIVLLKR